MWLWRVTESGHEGSPRVIEGCGWWSKSGGVLQRVVKGRSWIMVMDSNKGYSWRSWRVAGDHRGWSFRVPEGNGGWSFRVMGCCRG